MEAQLPPFPSLRGNCTSIRPRADQTTGGNQLVYDTEWHSSSRATNRYRLQNQLGRAIERTRRLLASPKAAEDPELAAIWQARLQRQEINFRGVCTR